MGCRQGISRLGSTQPHRPTREPFSRKWGYGGGGNPVSWGCFVTPGDVIMQLWNFTVWVVSFLKTQTLFFVRKTAVYLQTKRHSKGASGAHSSPRGLGDWGTHLGHGHVASLGRRLPARGKDEGRDPDRTPGPAGHPHGGGPAVHVEPGSSCPGREPTFLLSMVSSRAAPGFLRCKHAASERSRLRESAASVRRKGRAGRAKS